MISVREVVWIGEGKRHAEGGAARSAALRWSVSNESRARAPLYGNMRINGHRALGTVIQQQVGYINQLFPASASTSTYQLLYLATSAVQLPPEI